MENFIKIAFIIVFIFLFLCLGPWLMIWSINTLIAAAMVGAPVGAFVPHIAFGFWTWLAAALLGGLAVVFTSKRD